MAASSLRLFRTASPSARQSARSLTCRALAQPGLWGQLGLPDPRGLRGLLAPRGPLALALPARAAPRGRLARLARTARLGLLGLLGLREAPELVGPLARPAPPGRRGLSDLMDRLAPLGQQVRHPQLRARLGRLGQRAVLGLTAQLVPLAQLGRAVLAQQGRLARPGLTQLFRARLGPQGLLALLGCL